MQNSGSCLCGAVKITLNTSIKDIAACHCGMCRKWGSGPFLSIHTVDKIDIAGKEEITSFVSSAWAERAFCKKCGTHLFYRMRSSPDVFLAVGLFNKIDKAKLVRQIFVDKKPHFYHFVEQTEMLTEKDVLQQYYKDDPDVSIAKIKKA